MLNKVRLVAVFCCLAIGLNAQDDVNNVQLPALQLPAQRTNINVPDLDGYQTLKCDFHIHTVFSDGIVWPDVRVREAWEEGLDAIAITDHIENNPSKPHIGGDHNSSYEIALPAAKDLNILLIRAGEITRSMPPGHLNALFVEDVNKLDTENASDAIMEAHRQGGYIIWNHPGWKAQQPDTCRMFAIHNEFIRKGIINGMEVFNEKEWYPIVLGWCIDNKLAVIASSDIHDVNAHYYSLDRYHRPMTLVFAKERTLESLKQALFEKRTVAWFGKYVAGPEIFLRQLFDKSVSVASFPARDTKGFYAAEISNNSDFVLEFQPFDDNLDAFAIEPNSSVIVRIKQQGEFRYSIQNWFVNANEKMEVKLKF